MGLIFSKKRVVTEELENLTVQMNGYKKGIEKTFESRRMLLWYLTMLNFFLSTVLVGFSWYTMDDRRIQIALSVLCFVSGFILLILCRKLVNIFYEWRLNKKKKALDELIEKKKTILENVKETETFKIASEILEKYGDKPREPLPRPASQPASPVIERKSGPGPQTPQVMPGTPLNPQQGLRQRMVQNQSTPQRPGGPQTPARTIPMSAQMMPRGPPMKAVRPYHQEPTSAIYKVVDYFFSDGPSNRMALICSNCHAHNGMALPQEYEYLAFVCFICKHFNPAKKLREVPKLLPSLISPNEPVESQKEEHGDKRKEASRRTSETGTEDEFDVVNSRHSTDEETDKNK